MADYVLLADQDDIWHCDKVARQVQALQAAEAAGGRDVPRLVYCDAVVVDAARRPVHASFLRQNRLPYGSGRPLKTLLGRSFVLGCACAVNRPLLELALPLPEVAASHDWWLALCAAGAGEITCLDAPLLEYRRHGANASQMAFWKSLCGSPAAWRRRWELGWKSFLRSLDQAKALRDRLRERNVAAGEEGDLLEAFCRIVDQPGRWRTASGFAPLGRAGDRLAAAAHVRSVHAAVIAREFSAAQDLVRNNLRLRMPTACPVERHASSCRGICFCRGAARENIAGYWNAEIASALSQLSSGIGRRRSFCEGVGN